MFKHAWDATYVERKVGTPNAHRWANTKKAELETKHGVPFSWHTAHGKFVFSVTPCFRDIQPVNAPSYAKELLDLLKKQPHDFIWLKENTGWTWDVLFAVSKYLLNTQQATIVVNRTGKACGLNRKV